MSEPNTAPVIVPSNVVLVPEPHKEPEDLIEDAAEKALQVQHFGKTFPPLFDPRTYRGIHDEYGKSFLFKLTIFREFSSLQRRTTNPALDHIADAMGDIKFVRLLLAPPIKPELKLSLIEHMNDPVVGFAPQLQVPKPAVDFLGRPLKQPLPPAQFAVGPAHFYHEKDRLSEGDK